MKKLFLTLSILLSAVSGLAAIYVKQQGQTDKIYYAHRDHLGSILSLTDAAGTAVFKASYDAWGKQTVTYSTFKFHRGFTGHEHLPELALINMNGRMYDPILGRFLSPDPYVQAPEFSQSFNRYSYCVNNPLIYTDPDREAWHILIGGLVGGAINWISHGCKFNGEGASYFGAGFVAGAAVAAAPSAYAYIGAGLSAANSVIGQGFNSGWDNINPQQVLFDGIIGGATSAVAGYYGDKLSKPVSNLLGGIERPLLNNVLASEITGMPFGGLMGGLYALGDDDPTTKFWDGAWRGIKSAAVTSVISGIGNAAQYSIDNNVTFFTGKSNISNHAQQRSAERNISQSDIDDALKNPLKVTEVKYDAQRRPGIKYIGKGATVAVNPITGKIITVHGTHTKLLHKLENGK
jgi:RHS repeat-associated protein